MKQLGRKNQIFTIPNILSFVRLGLIPLMVWFYCGKQEYVWAGVILVISALTDVIDGFIARKFNMISDLGKVLDPIADKFTQGAMLLCLLLRFSLMLMPLVLMIAKEIFMSISGYAVIKKRGIVLGAHWHGKAATVCIFAMMMLHIFWVDIMPIASSITIGICTATQILGRSLPPIHRSMRCRIWGNTPI